MNQLEGLREIRFAGDAAGNVHAGYEEVYVGKKAVDSAVEIIKIRDGGNLGGACPLGCQACSGSIVAIHEKHAGGRNPFTLEFCGLEGKPLVVTAKDGAFTVGVDEDE